MCHNPAILFRLKKGDILGRAIMQILWLWTLTRLGWSIKTICIINVGGLLLKVPDSDRKLPILLLMVY